MLIPPSLGRRRGRLTIRETYLEGYLLAMSAEPNIWTTGFYNRSIPGLDAHNTSIQGAESQTSNTELIRIRNWTGVEKPLSIPAIDAHKPNRDGAG